MDFLDPDIEAYSEQFTQKESELLYDLNRQTHIKMLQPRMLSGHLQGRTLSMISKMIRPSRILEIGTYTGYAALCLAEGLINNGKLITIDRNHELEDMVNEYVHRSGMQDNIEFKIGDAIDLIPSLDETFDIVFIDADKENYINYYNLVFDKVRKGGVIIADNVLWSGKVLQQDHELDQDTLVLKQYNQMVLDDDRVDNLLLPIRDGLMIAQKK